MTVERLENEMSGEELDQWVEFFHEEPFGNEEKMEDMRHGVICSMIANATGKEHTPNDFMMYENKSKDEDSMEDWETKLLAAMTKV